MMRLITVLSLICLVAIVIAVLTFPGDIREQEQDLYFYVNRTIEFPRAVSISTTEEEAIALELTASGHITYTITKRAVDSSSENYTIEFENVNAFGVFGDIWYRFNKNGAIMAVEFKITSRDDYDAVKSELVAKYGDFDAERIYYQVWNSDGVSLGVSDDVQIIALVFWIDGERIT